MEYQYNDGGRLGAGYKGMVGDCVVRAIAIAAEKPYQEVYDKLFELNKRGMILKYGYDASLKASPRNGVYRFAYDEYIKSLGFKWVATMKIGTGCKIHLRSEELPMGRLIVRCSRHLVAVVNGVIHDITNPSRDGTRCVYGYYTK